MSYEKPKWSTGEHPKYERDWGAQEWPKRPTLEPKKHGIDSGSAEPKRRIAGEPKKNVVDVGSLEPHKDSVSSRSRLRTLLLPQQSSDKGLDSSASGGPWVVPVFFTHCIS
jgi:hypothetical protein